MPVSQAYLVLNDISYRLLLIIVRQDVEIKKKRITLVFFLTYLSTSDEIIVKILHTGFRPLGIVNLIRDLCGLKHHHEPVILERKANTQNNVRPSRKLTKKPRSHHT